MLVMQAPLKIETARLVLVAPSATDKEAVFERYASDREVTRFLGWPRHRTVADTQDFLAFSESQWNRDAVGPYLIRSRVDQRLLGGTGLALEPGGVAMTGYVLARDAWGNGYATEALQAMVDVASGIGIVRIYALCHPEHRASWRVLEKCGFARDEHGTRQVEFPNLERGLLHDAWCYARVFDEPNVD